MREAWVLRHVGVVLATGGIAVSAVLVVGMFLAPHWGALVDGRLVGAAKATAENAIRTQAVAMATLIAGAVVGLLAWARLDLSRQENRRNDSSLATDRYTRAVEQLGSRDPAVRLGALYALEALAHDSRAHRSTICEVVCAYARHHSVDRASRPRAAPSSAADEQPEGPPSDIDPTAPIVAATDGRAIDYRAAIAIALRLPASWQLAARDLRGIIALDLDLVRSEVGAVDFRGATFLGKTWFHGTTFRGAALFNEAVFENGADFGQAVFEDHVDFSFAKFTRRGPLDNAARFRAGSDWYTSDDQRSVGHRNIESNEGVRFSRASFFGDVVFVDTRFECWTALFAEAEFSGALTFEPRALEHCSFASARFKDDAQFYFPKGFGKVGFADSVFQQGAQFNIAGAPDGFEPRRSADGVRRWFWTGTSRPYESWVMGDDAEAETSAPTEQRIRGERP